MTDIQKKQISGLRSSGMSFAKIGKELNIPKETVKSFCRRNNIKVGENSTSISDDFCHHSNSCRCDDSRHHDVSCCHSDLCRYCAQPITQIKGKKKRSFCSKECCLAWWHSHPENIHKKALYTFTCANCGKEFTAYGNSKRKYCSHDCYISSRFKGGGNNERTRF